MDTTGTILFVEDDEQVREALTLLLRKYGLDVRTANHGLDALRKLQEQELPAVLIVDLNMPVMDGWDFLQQCPEGIPIVVLSGASDVQRTKAHPDVVAVLQKPITVDVLIRTLSPYVTGHLPVQ